MREIKPVHRRRAVVAKFRAVWTSEPSTLLLVCHIQWMIVFRLPGGTSGDAITLEFAPSFWAEGVASATDDFPHEEHMSDLSPMFEPQKRQIIQSLK
jgi:hypothetical protein